jgi:hypothetical protein
MPTVEQRPGPLDIAMVAGDDFTFTLHSSISLAGYTLVAASGSVTFSMIPTPGMDAGYYYNITITAAQSVLFTGDRAWTLSWTDPATKKRRFGSGMIRLIP